MSATELGGLVNPGSATDAGVRVATLDDFTILAATGGYLGKATF